MTSYFVIEDYKQVVSEGDKFFFQNEYGTRTPLEEPPQHGLPAYYRHIEGEPAQECSRTIYIDILEENVRAIKILWEKFQVLLDKELSR